MIKKILFSASVSLALLGAAIAQAQERVDRRAQNRDTFEMVCAGGPSNVVNVIPGRSAVEVEISFTRAPKSWKESNGSIPPGSCTWLDRPISANEPTRFRMRLSEAGKRGFNPRFLFFPGESPVTRSSRKHFVSVGQWSAGGLVVRINEEVPDTNRSRLRRWREIGRIDLSEGRLFTVNTRSLGDAMDLGRINEGPPRSEGIDLTSDNIRVNG